jgi:3-oxoadipate enol-lactonase/4-carboxymuconolactone decarboxylase
MPRIQLGDVSCFYRLEGADDRPVIVLSHSLGLDHGMWDAQTTDLLPHFRVLRYDIRGHGASSTPPGDYTIAELGKDVLGLADACGVTTFAWCGLSLGGMIGQWLAVKAPGRVTRLVLANTSPKLTDPQPMEARRVAVLEGGMKAVEELVMGRFFTPAVIASNAPSIASSRRTLLGTDPIGYVGMPWDAHAAVMAREITGVRVVRLPAAHISNLERPRSFSAALLDFLVQRSPDRVAAGLEVRRAVLGNDYVDRAIAGTTDFTRALQELITNVPWGTIWTRPGLDRRTRRLLVITTTAALGRWEEFRLHVRTGLAHELEPCDLEEVLLQVAVDAGVPAANAAFHIASEILAQSPGEKD